MSERVTIFVYGTLLSGEPNHYMLDDDDFVGDGVTEPEFTLAHLGAFPAMVRGGETAVHGELYEVGPATLVALDRLEGHPTFYRRAAITLDGGERVLTYVLPREKARGYRAINTGDWRSASKEPWR